MHILIERDAGWEALFFAFSCYHIKLRSLKHDFNSQQRELVAFSFSFEKNMIKMLKWWEALIPLDQSAKRMGGSYTKWSMCSTDGRQRYHLTKDFLHHDPWSIQIHEPQEEPHICKQKSSFLSENHNQKFSLWPTEKKSKNFTKRSLPSEDQEGEGPSNKDQGSPMGPPFRTQEWSFPFSREEEACK